jgi:universal stress protein A
MIPKNILVPTDFSPCAEHAVDYACELAAKFGATVYLVNALGAAPTELQLALGEAKSESLIGAHQQALEKLIGTRRAYATFGTPVVKLSDPREAILEAADMTDADLIVMGTHGRRGLSRMMMGSVAEDVVRNAPCPVLTVRSSVAPK